jgi:hypothetical protein
VQLSNAEKKLSAKLCEISRTGARLADVSSMRVGDEWQFAAGNVRALGIVVWFEGTECAIEFDTPLAVAEVSHLRSLANLVAGLSREGE